MNRSLLCVSFDMVSMSRYEKASPAPQRMLQLYSYENNQFCRLVREALCELELPYTLVNAGKGCVLPFFLGGCEFFCRLDREALCDLELPCILINAGKGCVLPFFLVDVNSSCLICASTQEKGACCLFFTPRLYVCMCVCACACVCVCVFIYIYVYI